MISTSIFDGRAVVVPVHNLFASSRMASRSPVVASQIKPATWTINYDDAKRWIIKAGDKLTLSQHGVEITLPVDVVDYVADGCIGYPDGLVPFMVGVLTTVKKAESDTPVYVPDYQKSVENLAKVKRENIFTPKTGFNNAPLAMQMGA